MVRGNSKHLVTLCVSLASVVLMVIANLAATRWVATDAIMGDSQRIVYVHVSVAWLSLVAYVLMAGSGLQYLRSRELRWDHWSHAASEVGWLSSSLTLLTGSLWAHEAWGTWWTWDPRLTTAFLLWLMYSAGLVLRTSVTDAHRRAQVVAILSILGLVDIPFVTMSTRWFRGIHPVSTQMEPDIRAVLDLPIVGYSSFLGMFLFVRERHVCLFSDL